MYLQVRQNVRLTGGTCTVKLFFAFLFFVSFITRMQPYGYDASYCTVHTPFARLFAL